MKIFKIAKKRIPISCLLFFSLTASHSTKVFSATPLTCKFISPAHLFGKGIEGPAVDRQGNLYAVNFGGNGSIAKMEPSKPPVLWLKLMDGGIANSLRFTPQGELIAADRINHRILKLDLKTKGIEILASEKEMNQPNDFTISRSGLVYFSDPSWNKKKPGHIWQMSLTHRKITRAATDQKAINGIDLSPDDSKLYFSESSTGRIGVFDINANKLGLSRTLQQFEPESVDGLRTDSEGNIYVARIGKGEISVLDPQGKILRSIKLNGMEVTNLAFGGTDGKTIYVTQKKSGQIESCSNPVPGREWVIQETNKK